MNKKIIWLTLISILLISLWTYIFLINNKEDVKVDNIKIENINTQNIKTEKVKTENIKTEKVKTDTQIYIEYWEITKYFDKDLSDFRKERLLFMLWEREKIIEEDRERLNQSLIDNNFDEVYTQILIERKECAQKFLFFVIEEKKDEFIEYCTSLNNKLKDEYIK